MTTLQANYSTELHERIRDAARSRNAVILAHNYERPEVQDVADYVGDSLGLSREAAKTEADVIVFCGVHFMAETAKILSPSKTVLLPDMAAGCSLAASIDAEQLRAWKAEHPGAVVVSYVNTTAEVKAETDYCCTSGNAVEVINAIPEDREILFCPDMFLGAHGAGSRGGRTSTSGWASATCTRGSTPSTSRCSAPRTPGRSSSSTPSAAARRARSRRSRPATSTRTACRSSRPRG
jgi:quinolinate synthase